MVLAVPTFAASNEVLVGPQVGNADTFTAEGSKLFNKKQYAKAADQFLKATRSNPGAIGTYVQLARALMLAKQTQRACYAYRVYLNNVAEGAERKKAAAESDQCERQLKLLRNPPVDESKEFVDLRAAFFTALDARQFFATNSASESLRTLIRSGFLGPELADMASKLGNAASTEADSIHDRALRGEKLSPEVLRSARPLYQLAFEFGTAGSGDSRGRVAFLDGLAEFNDKAWKKAEAHFVDAAKRDPNNKEYIFYRALTLLQAGERQKALKTLEAELKDDARTAVLRVSTSINDSPDAGALELEAMLFNTRHSPDK